MSGKTESKSSLPKHIRQRIAAPERPRDLKITARFTEDEYKVLEMLGKERQEKVSSLMRHLVLATVEEIREDLRR